MALAPQGPLSSMVNVFDTSCSAISAGLGTRVDMAPTGVASAAVAMALPALPAEPEFDDFRQTRGLRTGTVASACGVVRAGQGELRTALGELQGSRRGRSQK